VKKIKYRIQYSKTGLTRFTSHLDVLRAINRTIRRSGLPIAFSMGFNPVPRLSFGPPLPLGIESEAEFFDLELTADLSKEEVFHALKQALPPGLQVIKVGRLVHKVQSLTAMINSIVYQFILVAKVKQCSVQLEDWFERLWESAELNVIKNTKSGKKSINLRPFWKSYKLAFTENDIILFAIEVEFGPRGTIRPDDFCSLLSKDFQVERVIRKEVFSRAGECCKKVL
jgi:radical SAM-linked protein